MKPIEAKYTTNIGLIKKRNTLNLRLVTMYKYKDLKFFCKRLCSKLLRRTACN